MRFRFLTTDFCDCFLGDFIFDCIFSCHQLSLPWLLFVAFLSGTLFLCCCTASATDLRELFLVSGVFYLSLLPEIWHNLLLSRLSWEKEIPPWRLQGLPLMFETQIRLICLFESHSVQQKLLDRRFYLCVKALRNTISTSIRYLTHSLIATYVVRCM